MGIHRRTSLAIMLMAFASAWCWSAPPSSRQYHIQTDEGPERYFRYQTDSGQYRKEKRLADGTVVGSEGWVDANGYLRLKDYIADGAGYRILKSKTLFVGRGRPIDEAIKSAKSAPAQSGILAGPRAPSYIPPAPSPVYITPRPPPVAANAIPTHQKPSLDFLPPIGPTSVAPLPNQAYIPPATGYIPSNPSGYIPPSTVYAPPSKDYVPSSVIPLSGTYNTPSTPRPFQSSPSKPDTFYVPSSTVRPLTGFVSSTENPVRVLTPSTAHPIPSYELSAPSYPSSVAPLSNYGSSTPSPLSSHYASTTGNPVSTISSYPSSTANPISSYGSSTANPFSNYISSTASPISSHGSSTPVSSYSPSSSTHGYSSSSAHPSYDSSTTSYGSSSTANPLLQPYEDAHKSYSVEPQPFSLKYRDSNSLGDGYRSQYPTSDGVYTTKTGFRYFLPRLYHEEANDGEERIGSFGYVDPFGIRRVIYYNAGPGTGFRHRHNNRYVGLNGTPYDPRPL